MRAAASLTRLNAAQKSYAASSPAHGFACRFAQLHALDTLTESGTSSGYKFELHCAEPESAGYTLTAVPSEPGVTGKDALCTDQSGSIWYSENGSATECLAQRKPAPPKYDRYIDAVRR